MKNKNPSKLFGKPAAASRMKEIKFSANTEFGARLLNQIKSVDDGTPFLSSGEFYKKYEKILKAG